MSDYDALRKVINHEANQEDDSGFFAKLYGPPEEQDDDGPTAKGLFQQMTRSNDENRADCHTPWENRYNRLPPGLSTIINRTGRPILISPYPRQRKRRPIVKVRSKNVAIGDCLTVKSWKWECRICKQTWWSLDWWTTQNSATHHAHNHH